MHYTMLTFVLGLTLVANILPTEQVTIQAPIPFLTRPTGYILNGGTRDAKVVIEAYLELVCPDSAHAWVQMKQLTNMYKENDVTVVVHWYILPYHRNAYVVTQAFHLIEEHYPTSATAFADAIYKHYDYLKASATEEMNDNQVLDYVADIAYYVTGMATDEFKAQIPSYKRTVREEWKLGATRGVAGTPWYFINGVDSGLDPGVNVDVTSWIALVDTLLKSG